MYLYTPGHTRILGIGVYLPSERVSSRAILEEIDSKNRFGVPYDWLDRAMGIHERRAAPTGTRPSDMAVAAAREALDQTALPASAVDAIIYVGIDNDCFEPATAHIVQDKLDAGNAIAFDVTNACHGFMNGIHLMDALIATNQVRHGLVVTGERGYSRATRESLALLRQKHERSDFAQLVGGLTTGDAGAAMLLGPKLDPDTGFVGFMLQSQGQYSGLCVYAHRGEESVLKTDMPGIVEAHLALHERMFPACLDKLDWTAADIKRFVHHQVGARAFRLHARYSGVDTGRMTDTVSRFGNLTTATIPVNLYNLINSKELERGDRVFISGAGSGLAISQTGLVWDLD